MITAKKFCIFQKCVHQKVNRKIIVQYKAQIYEAMHNLPQNEELNLFSFVLRALLEFHGLAEWLRGKKDKKSELLVD